MKPDFSTRPGTRQRGYALIMMVLALMGVGGVVLAGFTQGVKQEAEQERYLHNQRVLREAKQALLQYAYNYPQMGNGAAAGPGRLLCPDMDNDGDPDSSLNCISGNPMVGRFPWNEPDLQFYDARDASGERLWLAVSKNFAYSGNQIINSATQGSITVQDRSGAISHDSTAGTGVAAVIIAPGPLIERGGVMQVRTGGFDDPSRLDPANYLDLFGAVDNADFINTDPDGFVTGPIRDVVTGDLLVNDQMIIVTAAEVIAMAEQATLQAYRKAIDDYLDLTGDVYPWLFNYEGIEYDEPGGEPVSVAVAKLSSLWPADDDFVTERDTYLGLDTSGDDDGIFGRIPSIFAPYFSDVDSGSIESKVRVKISNAELAGNISYTRTFPSEATGTYTFVDSIDGFGSIDIDRESDEPITDLRFEEDTTGDDIVKLIGTIAADETYSDTLWFWSRNDIGVTEWSLCLGGANQVQDCRVDSGYNPDPWGAGEQDIQILKVEVELVFDSSAADEVEFELDVSNLPGAPANPVIAAADGNGHAWIGATFDVNEVLSNKVITIRYEWDDHFTVNDWGADESGTIDFGNIAGAELQVGLRYYPELPGWMLSNGWHDSIRMAYALEYKPPGAGPCTVDTTCLQLDDAPGTPRDKASLLMIGGTHDWQDTDLNGRLKNDLMSVYDDGNHNDNPTFYHHRGNDKLLVIEEL